MQKQVQLIIGIGAILVAIALGVSWIAMGDSDSEAVAKAPDAEATHAPETAAPQRPQPSSSNDAELSKSRPSLGDERPVFVSGGPFAQQRKRAKEEFEEMARDLSMSEEQRRAFLLAVLDFQMERQSPLAAAEQGEHDDTWEDVHRDSSKKLRERLDRIFTTQQRAQMGQHQPSALAMQMAIAKALAVE